MCDPVSGTMMALSLMQAQQQQQAEDSAVRAQNAMAEENNRMQNEALQRDMGSFYDEEINIQEDINRSLEDTAEEKLRLQIQGKREQATLQAQNLETVGGGQSADAIIANHHRNVLMAGRDIEDNFQRGVASARREKEGLQRDKINRRYQAISAINSTPRSGYASQGSRFGKMALAGAQGYYTGSTIKKPSSTPKGTGAYARSRQSHWRTGAKANPHSRSLLE